MPTVGWLAVGALALICHELVVFAGMRRRLSRSYTLGLRVGILGLALVATAIAGPSVIARFHEFAEGRAKENGPFMRVGVTDLVSTLSSQRPRRPFPVGGSEAEGIAWRQTVIRVLREDASLTSDESSRISVRVLGSEMVGTIRRSLVTFVSGDGSTIPAYIHHPGGDQRRAGVLVIPGHGSGIRATSGLVDDYQHAGALALARRGYVTLTPELRGFGLLSSKGEASHRSIAAAALQSGSSYKAVVARDLGRALTVLSDWPGVDAGRLGVVGTSLGGELAVLLGAIDDRVRVVISHSHGGSTGPVTVDGDVQDDSSRTPHGCHIIPGINRILLQEDWSRLVAPRPLLVVRGTQDVPFGLGEYTELVGAAYAMFRSADHFAVSVEPGGHEFYPEPAIRFLERWLPGQS